MPASSSPDAQVAVRLRHVCMRYGDFHAVKDASFDLLRGKFLTILGPSGSGKTTLLRLIAGFGAPSSGEIFINGQPVKAVPAHQRAIGMVFQRLALFPHMTAAQNVAFPLKMRRHDARGIDKKVAHYLELVRLGGHGARRLDELSGGQQQRVAIARALVFEPDLLLLDEPLAALDVKLREEMQLEFRRIQRELGVTTINVTHDQREALVVSDEIIVMNDGLIQQKAEPAVAYHQPQNVFVANFVGTRNFLPGVLLRATSEEITLRCGRAELSGRPGAPGNWQTGAPCAGALRAEQVRMGLAPDGLAGAHTRFAAQVLDAIFEGERMVYVVRVPELDGASLRVFDHTSTHAGGRIAPGAQVHVGWNPQDVLVFQDLGMV